MSFHSRPTVEVNGVTFKLTGSGLSSSAASPARTFRVPAKPSADRSTSDPTWVAALNACLASKPSTAPGVAGCAACALLLMLAIAGLWPLGVLAAGALAVVAKRQKRADELWRTTVVLYDLDPGCRAAFERFCAAFDELRHCGLVQRVQERTAATDLKYSSGAQWVVSTAPANPRYAEPPSLRCNVSVPAWAGANGWQLYFLPDCLLLLNGPTLHTAPYAQLSTAVTTSSMILDVAPSDAKVVGHTWRYVNKKGGPDKRFANNPQLPNVELAELAITALGTKHAMQVSRLTAATALREALIAMGQAQPISERALGVEPAPRPAPTPLKTAPAPLQAVPPPANAANDEAVWVPPGKSVVVAGRTIPGGMIYVGDRLPPVCGDMAWVQPPHTEPALIVPTLRVDAAPDRSGTHLRHDGLTYSGLSPACRAAYLDWLAGGRRDRGYAGGYALLFVFGLERRLLQALPRGAQAWSAFDALGAELRRLLDRYDDDFGFQYTARPAAKSLLDLVGALQVKAGAPAKAPLCAKPTGWPLTVAVGLGTLVRAGSPIPWDWALAWWLAGFHDYTGVRTPATRCWQELQALFRARFAQRFENGIVVHPSAMPLRLSYLPASPSFGGEVGLDCPALTNVTGLEATARQIGALFEECQVALEPYSRWLGRHDEDRHNPQALALLPTELLDRHQGKRLTALRDGLHRAIGDGTHGTVPAAGLIKLWLGAEAPKLAKKDHLGLAQLLGKLGYGLVPDPSFGDAVLTADTPVVVFRQSAGSPETPSVGYDGLALLLRLFVAVATADGPVGPAAQARLGAYAAAQHELSAGERARVTAHSRWLVLARPGLGGLRARLARLSSEKRESVGLFLVSVAGVEGAITPSKVKALTSVYEALGLSPAALHSHLHALTAPAPTATPTPPTEPVTVQPARPGQSGYALPTQPEPALPAGGLQLDMAAVAAKLEESGRVAAMLGEIFAEAEQAAEPPPAAIESDDVVTGLDHAHSALLRQLATHERLTRAAFGELCDALGLLPDGALDRLNEAALDAVDEVLCEAQDEDLVVDPEVAKELLSG